MRLGAGYEEERRRRKKKKKEEQQITPIIKNWIIV